jgi:hypothetical protein
VRSEAISKTYSIYFNCFAFGKVQVEFRRNGPVSDRKPVPNPKPPDKLGFLNRFPMYFIPPAEIAILFLRTLKLGKGNL